MEARAQASAQKPEDRVTAYKEKNEKKSERTRTELNSYAASAVPAKSVDKPRLFRFEEAITSRHLWIVFDEPALP